MGLKIRLAQTLLAFIPALTLSMAQDGPPKAPITVNFLANGGGTLKGNLHQTLETPGETTPVKAIANRDNLFNFWILEGKPFIKNEIVVKASGDRDITAHFVGRRASIIGQMGPNIRGINQKGESAILSDYFGKVILLQVVSEDSASCSANAPAFEAIHQNVNPEKCACVSIMHSSKSYSKPKKETLQEWIDKHGLTMPVQNDSSGSLNGYANKCYFDGAAGSPCFIVLDRTFLVRYLGHDLDQALLVAQESQK